jgi:hypothetical protein
MIGARGVKAMRTGGQWLLFWLARCVDARDERRVALLARTDQQHQWTVAGDERGVTGNTRQLAKRSPIPDTAVERCGNVGQRG